MFDPDIHAATDMSAEQIFEDHEALAAALEALGTLPKRTQTIFVMRRIDGLAYKDIAEKMDLSVSGVEKQVSRATRHMVEHQNSQRLRSLGLA